jgi:hypothetical protein
MHEGADEDPWWAVVVGVGQQTLFQFGGAWTFQTRAVTAQRHKAVHYQALTKDLLQPPAHSGGQQT